LIAGRGFLARCVKKFYTLSTMIRSDSYQNQGGEVMNKKLAVVAALILGAAGLFLAQATVKAQDATDNSAMANSDAGAMMNSDAAAPAAPAAQ